MSNILNLSNITKTYKTPSHEVQVLQGVDLSVNKGQKVAIIGQSGSGKSTLLHIAGLLDHPTEGSVTLNGAHTKSMRDKARATMRNKHMGFVYQSHHLMREFTALENIMMPAIIQNGKTKATVYRATELLTRIGLGERASHYPSQLSGGEQQRVAIARALMNKPDLLLADEPTGNLDPETADVIYDLFNNMVKEEGMALLMVTHNHELAKQCDDIYTLTKGHLAHG